MNILRSKTIQFAILLAVLGVLEANLGVFEAYMNHQTFGFFSIAVGVIVAVLRIVTTVPLSEK